jgi:hypothetical protein
MMAVTGVQAFMMWTLFSGISIYLLDIWLVFLRQSGISGRAVTIWFGLSLCFLGVAARAGHKAAARRLRGRRRIGGPRRVRAGRPGLRVVQAAPGAG